MPTPQPLGDLVTVVPWPDPATDRTGHDPRSRYVEHFWLPVVGPSTVLFVRRVAMAFDTEPTGVTVELDVLSRSLGLGRHGSPKSSVTRTLRRACQFGLARFNDDEVLAVRRRLPKVAAHHIARLPPALQRLHISWVDETRAIGSSDRAPHGRQLALRLAECGQRRHEIYAALVEWRFGEDLATKLAAWAIDQQRPRDTSVTPVDQGSASPAQA
jgi:hypothetical protein